MNASLMLIQTILGMVPNILSYATAIRATLSTQDQATLDQMIATHRAAALASVSQADLDLDAASKITNPQP